jgi:hypothetical protein
MSITGFGLFLGRLVGSSETAKAGSGWKGPAIERFDGR